ncbi:MAG: 50S ribosomal protein L18 [bacterium]|nr:50S ribosomal protein L18 [bacterium]
MKSKRIARHKRIRAKIKGTKARPRLSVFRSSKHLFLQLVDDAGSRTLFGVSDASLKKGTKTERARLFGRQVAKNILELKVASVVFDRGGYKYQGRVKALAEALREGGVKF